MTNALDKLDPIVKTIAERLESYSKYKGRHPNKIGTMDALLELPHPLWPETAKAHLAQLKKKIKSMENPLPMQFSELFGCFPEWRDKSKKKMELFYDVLAAYGVGIEPDIRFGGSVPDPSASIVLFGLGDNPISAATPQYAMAAFTLHLAMVVWQADGEVPKETLNGILEKLGRCFNINPPDKTRLQAYLHWLATQDLNLSGLKKRFERLENQQKSQLGDILIQLVQMEQAVTVPELKLMERIFGLLGIDKAAFYSKVHAVATEPVSVYVPVSKEKGFEIPRPAVNKKTDSVNLDMKKVAQLEADSNRVGEILGAIFNEPESETEKAAQEHLDKNDVGLLGLPQGLSDFVHLLSEKPSWNRAELETLAANHGILLDGALEQINDAAFDHFDNLFSEGSDPIEINMEIVEAISQ